MKTILPIIVGGLLLFSGVNVVALNMEKQATLSFSDELDQSQTESDGGYFVGSYLDFTQQVAQSFVPQKSMLTRIQLLIAKSELYVPGDPYIVGIRKTIKGENLAEASIDANDIPFYTPEWIEFDSEDIYVDVGETYYIVCYSLEQEYSGIYFWSMIHSDKYPGGLLHWSQSKGQYWNDEPSHDCCFKTFGYDPPIQIDVKGGIGVTVTVQNNGDEYLENISWTIDLSGIIFFQRFREGVIESLPVGGEDTIKTGLVFGIGPGTVHIFVGEIIKEEDIFLLGPFVIIRN